MAGCKKKIKARRGLCTRAHTNTKARIRTSTHTHKHTLRHTQIRLRQTRAHTLTHTHTQSISKTCVLRIVDQSALLREFTAYSISHQESIMGILLVPSPPHPTPLKVIRREGKKNTGCVVIGQSTHTVWCPRVALSTASYNMTILRTF